MSFPFKTTKFKNDISYIKYSHIDLGKNLGDWTCIIQILE
jgi:hypothetical protein